MVDLELHDNAETSIVTAGIRIPTAEDGRVVTDLDLGGPRALQVMGPLNIEINVYDK